MTPRLFRCLGLAALVASLLGSARGGDVVINEIHYDSEKNTVREEFIELHNAGEAVVELAGWRLADAVEYTFEAGARLEPGGYVVVAENPETLAETLGFARALGPYAGRLSNDGEQIVLLDAEGAVVDEVEFDAGFPWPYSANGEGSSMELIHPSLDNDLGGSWRPSGLVHRPFKEREFFVEGGDASWRMRKATSEPPPDWMQLGFTEDDTWTTVETPVGFGDDDDATVLDDMQNAYSGVYLRRSFSIAEGDEIPQQIKLSLYFDDGVVAWINGREVARIRAPEGEPPPFDATASRSHEAREFEDVVLNGAGDLLRVGENLIAVHALNVTLGSNDFSIDARLFVPGSEDFEGQIISPPTPGVENTVRAENAPPQVRQVDTRVRQPVAGESNVVTAKVTDPDGVASVELHFQIVPPGSYIPAELPVPVSALISNAETPREPNPAFEDPANWTSVRMVDNGAGGDEVAGDDVYSAPLPGQPNRTLVRYRITVADSAGESVRVPYRDDPSLNFAYFVYDGVPDYHAETSILREPTTHAAEKLASVPVYTLITRDEDLRTCIAASSGQQIPQGRPARFSFNWEGAFVHDGYVYDHIRYRLRGANGRYQVPSGNPANTAGKRHWRFRFHKGNFLRARDRFGRRYPTRWRVLNTGRMFGNRIDGNWGLGDQVNDIIWNAYGVPAAEGHVFHWRVVRGEEEAPAGDGGQYLGDFFGIARAFENYDVRFLEAHDLPKGNLYKLVNQTRVGLEQQRYQAADAVDDGSDHNNIESRLRSNASDEWLLAHVNYERWYRYHAVVQAIRHYDYWPEANKNAAWYFEPDYNEANGFRGRMWTLPFDTDATWGPNWNEGRDRPFDAITSKPEFQKDYRNHVREVRDLLWQRDQLELIIRHVAAFMDPLEEADIDRWRNGPPAAGRQYFGAASQRSLEGKVADMLRFAFDGGSWPGGSVGRGGRAAFLDQFADGRDRRNLPETPVVEFVGSEGFPMDDLSFATTEFADPQGVETFAAMRWRIAEVTSIPDAGSVPLDDPVWTSAPIRFELEPTWESSELDRFEARFQFPFDVVDVGSHYRVRVRMKDDTNLWSHWSAPVEFVAGAPSSPILEIDDLRITEIMYNPIGGSDYEFIELQNKGAATLDLTRTRFVDGVEFDFAEGDVPELGPGEIVVIVRDRSAFESRYGADAVAIAGEFSSRLANGGEQLKLAFGKSFPILDFVYDDVWYPETDGGGASLTIVDVDGPTEAWGTAEAWRPSAIEHGTPGAVDGPVGDGHLRPGDVNADGSLNTTDAIALLRILFVDVPIELPCAGDDPNSGTNLTLLDFDGGGSINVTDAIALLRYLFMRGPAHVAGRECRSVAGCEDACVP